MNKAYFPTGIAYVATFIQNEGYEFDIIDIEANRYSNSKLEELLGSKNYDIIATGTLVSGYKYIKKILYIARKTNPNAIIIAGNSVASSISDFLITNTEVDVAVKGEGEITFLKILKAKEEGISLDKVPGIMFLQKGKIIDTGYETQICEIKELHHPNWELFDIDLYLQKAIQDVPKPYPIAKEEIRAFTVNTARGCPFRCTFCYHVFQYTKYRYRSVNSILSEISILQKKYGINYINFFDELTFLNKKQVNEFLKGIEDSGIIFYWNADIRSDLFSRGDIELLKRLREAGCMGFGYSLESGDQYILKSMNKKLRVEDFIEQKKALDEAGISSFTSLVIGYPEETLKSLKKTFDICYELNIYPSTGYLLPQPGTPMFEVAKKKGFAQSMDDYLMKMGDRQDLRFNLTNIPDDVLQNEVSMHLNRINEKMGLNLKNEQLIKTSNFLTSNQS